MGKYKYVMVDPFNIVNCEGTSFFFTDKDGKKVVNYKCVYREGAMPSDGMIKESVCIQNKDIDSKNLLMYKSTDPYLNKGCIQGRDFRGIIKDGKIVDIVFIDEDPMDKGPEINTFGFIFTLNALNDGRTVRRLSWDNEMSHIAKDGDVMYLHFSNGKKKLVEWFSYDDVTTDDDWAELVVDDG